MGDLSIGEVAHRAGIRASAIRYYEQAGLLPEPRRISGRRRYDPGVLDLLALIRFAQEAGFTIAEIHGLVQGFEERTPISLRWQALARPKVAEIEALIARARHMRRLLDRVLSCGCVQLDECARAIHACPGGEVEPASSRS